MTFNKNATFLEGLQTKVSHPRLEVPAPNANELANCYQAAFRSPDHAYLRPWRFIECREQEREQLGQLFVDALGREQSLSEAQLKKLANAPLRAPLVLICYAEISEHEKVPEIEQLLAAGCAVNNFSLALYAQGYGSVWRTGDPAHSLAVHQALNLSKHQTIIGYLYVGTPSTEDKALPVLEIESFVCSLTDQLAPK